MKRISLLLLASIFLTSNASSPFAQRRSFESEFSNKATDPKYRLPEQPVTISRYDIELMPYFEGSRAFTFDGTAKITGKAHGTIVNKVSQITFHAKQLIIEKVTMNVDGTDTDLDVNTIDETYDFWVVKFSGINDKDFTITVKYTGVMGDDMHGFYKSSYLEFGNLESSSKSVQTKWMATTQFQPVHARRAFPCFDEPGYKAIFKITMKRPKSFSVTLSNVKIDTSVPDGEYVVDTFHDTPIMSAYLVAFIVSEYVPANETELAEPDYFGIWARPDAKDQGEYAFVTSKKIVDKLGEYLNLKFSTMDANLKNDHVAIPDFSAGAMENWGIATYREGYLMYDSEETSARYQQQIATILSHEITHFWFGDLVTCKWWSETWLNEGFARYFQYYLTDMIEDEDNRMDMASQFTVAQMHTVMVADASNTSTPMTNVDTNSPAEVQGQFGTVSYSKGASVIRMTKDLIGESTFQKGLQEYMDKMKFQAVVETDLFKSLQDAVTANTVVLPDSETVADFMKSWTNFNGFPYLDVEIERKGADSKIVITQKRFMKKYTEYEAADRLWHIPITYTKKSESNFDDLKPGKILSVITDTISTPIGDGEWVMFNLQQSGYYRVHYDYDTLKLITEDLKDENNTIHEFNKAQLVDDLFNFAREDMMNYTHVLESTRFLQNNTEYAPWSAAMAGFSYMKQKFVHFENAYRQIEKHIFILIKNLIQDLDFEEKAEDKHLRKLFRINTFNFVCQLGFGECEEKSKLAFDKLKAGESIAPNLREYVYCTALRLGSAEDFDLLWNKYLTANVVNEKIIILNALGCSSQTAKLEKLLTNTLLQGSDIKDQDKMAAFNSVLNGNNVDVAFSFVKDNVMAIKKAYGESSLPSMISSIASRMSSKQLEELGKFLISNIYLTEEEKSSGESSIENAMSDLEWAEGKSEDIEKYLEDLNGSAGALKVSFLLMMFTSLLVFLNKH